MKPMMRTPNRTKSRMILHDPHAYWVPPHWSARSKQMIAGINAAVPSRSNSLMRAAQPRSATAARSGFWKKNAMPTIVTAPNGKLI